MLAEDLFPVGHAVELGVESYLGFDDATDAVVGTKIRVEVGVVAETLVVAIASLVGKKRYGENGLK